jgi:hypothetical protein
MKLKQNQVHLMNKLNEKKQNRTILSNSSKMKTILSKTNRLNEKQKQKNASRQVRIGDKHSQVEGRRSKANATNRVKEER